MLNSTKKVNFDIADRNYTQLLEEAKHKIISTRIQIAKTATYEQFNLYWWFGEHIVEAQKKYGWGKSIVDQLGKDLREAFPSTTFGFSARNLWEMRRFYLEYRELPNLQQLVAEIPWGQNLVILNKVKDSEARQFYLEMTRKLGWTRSTLVLQINSQAYEQHTIVKKQNNFIDTLPRHLAFAHSSMQSATSGEPLLKTASCPIKAMGSRQISDG